jgi:hypothetical protein
MRSSSPALLIGRCSVSLSLATVLVAAGPSSARAQAQHAAAPTLAPELERARAALHKYQDPIVAVHDGYLSTVACIDYPNGGGEGPLTYAPGGMGVHFLNPGLIGPGPLDPAKPQVLIYEPDGDKLRLVAAEWFVPVPVAGQARPAIFGKELDGPMAGHKPFMPEGLHHYDLHVWLWKSNPAGVFAPTNPALKCPAGAYTSAMDVPRLVPHGKH